MRVGRSVFLSTLVLALSACGLHAPPATGASSWAAVTSLRAGTVLRVTWFDISLADLPTERVQGTFLGADGATLTVDTNAGPRRLPRTQIHRIDAAEPKGRRDSVANGALIGGLIGTGMVAVMAGTSRSSDPMPYPIALMIVGSGTAVGALIDSTMKAFDYRTVYLREPPSRGGGRRKPK
jgi:hypothetical protein